MNSPALTFFWLTPYLEALKSYPFFEMDPHADNNDDDNDDNDNDTTGGQITVRFEF